jgi:flagellar FliL protein
MAEEEKKNEEATEPKEKKSSNMLMIIIIVVLILIIILGAVAAIFLIGSDEEDATANVKEPQAQERTVEKETRKPGSVLDGTRKLDEIGTLYPLDTFTVNLKSDSGRRYLKVAMSLELEGEELSMELDAKTAVIRDRIIRILSSKTLEEISSKKGKQKVTEQIMDTLNAMLSDGRIKGIYFTEFVIQ